MATSFVTVHEYPLPTRHEGAPLGNGYLGLYAWGTGRELSLTVGCGALWDHRGGMKWSPAQNYRDIRRCLEAKDEAGLKAIFKTVLLPNGNPQVPTIIPVARLVLTLREGATLLRNELDRSQGLVRCVYGMPDGNEGVLELRVDMEQKCLFAFRCADVEDFRLLSGYESSIIDGGNWLGALGGNGYPPPQCTVRENFWGFVQEMPADPAYGLAVRKDGELWTAQYWQGLPADELERRQLVLDCVSWTALSEENLVWWKDYWQKTPKLSTGNDVLDELYLDGMFKFGAMTTPGGVAAGLQGPWIEDCGYPPWSSDYHFNINLEMCYWPAFRAGLFENLRIVLDMVWSWREQLRENARFYIGIPDGYMLPHSVDDRCTCMGDFWTGAVDHACTAWVAQMMFDYYDYSGDRNFLESVAYPFMKGAMNVYLAQMETRPDGTLCLPLTTSPEYRDAQMDAWGANASFQLAACHRLNRNLLVAAEILGETPDPRWKDVEKRLPVVSLYGDREHAEIGLWDGLALEESHRHHSHLAGLCPFDVIDPEDPAWAPIVARSFERWVNLGMGQWSGWCLSWAAMLMNRLNHPEAAEMILEIWKRVFNNKGGASTHDAQFQGFSTCYGRPNIMQMDGAMGCLAAVQDCFLHSRQGVLHLFAGISRRRAADAGFEGLFAPGGFRVNGKRTMTETRVELQATRDHELRLICHCGGQLAEFRLNGKSLENAASNEIRLEMRAGDCLLAVWR